MSTKLPSINIIKNKNININLKLQFNIQEIKNNISRNNNKENKLFNIKNLKNRTTNSFDENIHIKRIALTSLLNRKPTTIYNKPFLSKKKSNDSNKILRNGNSKIFGRPLLKSSSVKLYPTGSFLKRLTVGNIDEILKFNYYKKIEDSKSYQDYLIKESAYIPQESIDNSFVESSNNNKDTINNHTKSKYIFNRNSIYELLNPLNKKNTIKIKSKFKNQEIFEKFIIERFIRNQQKSLNRNEILKRNIFILLDGEILINENNIKGFFIELPNIQEIKLLKEEKRKNIMKNILQKSQIFFKSLKPIMAIFTPDLEFISDIKEIKEEYKYIYASSNILCKGVSLVTTPNFLKLYKKEFKNYLKIETINNKLKNEYQIIDKKNKLKVKEISQGIRPKYEVYKPHYSYAEGENKIEYKDYVIYSDDDERKTEVKKKILNDCYLKNDFFLYLNDKNTSKKVSELKSKLKFDKPFDLRESYKQFNVNFDKLLERYKKEIQKKLRINPKIYITNQIDSKKNSHNLQYPYDKLTKLYLSRSNKKPFKREHISNNSFYNSVDNKIKKYYTTFILYNIPKLLSEFKNYTRHRLYEIYTKYKDLVVMSYCKNKTDFILKSGVDFDTFWYCVEQLSDEKKKFVEKIYNQINRSKLCVLNMKDFLRGMYFVQNSEITEKLDLFLKALDISGKGVINYKEAVDICKEAIQRNLSDKNQDNENNIYALNELSQFFANFIFKLIGVDTSKELRLDDLKKAILQKNNEFNEIEYLEMFCGANK